MIRAFLIAFAPLVATVFAENANRLASSASPYLRQHAGNPVDWHPWGDDAFAKARRENKPVFLSSGYSTCHWCHVMNRESFSDPAVAAFLNEHFVPIKLDREERPDIDRIYLAFVSATTGRGGWPLNVWLTPNLRPFLGGTYFPPVARDGAPSRRSPPSPTAPSTTRSAAASTATPKAATGPRPTTKRCSATRPWLSSCS